MILPADPNTSVHILLIIAFLSAPASVVLAAIEPLIHRRFPAARSLVRGMSVLLIVACFGLLFGYVFLASTFGLR